MNQRFWRINCAVFLGACLGMTGCAGAPQLENSVYVRELGEDIYGNPALYIKDPEKWHTEEMQIEARSSGLRIQDNRYVSANLSYLGVGEYDFVLIENGRETPFVIKVKDTQAPVSRLNPDRIEVQLKSTIQWEDVFQADDLSGVYYEAPVNITQEAGEKNVQVKIRDRFGNSTIKDITVEVLP